MTDYPNIAARLFGRPLAVEPGRLHAIIGALGQRLGVQLDAGELEAAEAARGGGASPREPRITGNKVAVIPVLNGLVHRHGRLNADSGVMESYQRIGARLEEAASSRDVAGIILDIDSPGGEVDGLMSAAQAILEVRKSKPVYAVANESAYSAAYWLASAADRIFIPTTAGVGSIGVIAMHVDQSQFDEKMGLRYSTVTAGARKADFSPHAPLGEEAQKRLKAEVDRVQGLFLDHVGAMRPQAKLADVRDASLFFGADAVRVGLADQIGGIEEAIAAMTQELNESTVAGPAATVNHPAPAAAASPPAASSVIDLAQAREAGAADAVERVVEISQLCRIAGRAEMLGEFLEKKLTVAQVREALINARADASDAAHAGVDHRSLAGPAAGDVATGSQLWRDAYVAAFGKRALEVPGKNYYDKATGGGPLMATVLNEGQYRGEFMISEAPGFRSREEVTISSPATPLQAGTVLSRVTATGEYVIHAPGGAGGAETAAAILWDNVTPLSPVADVRVAAIVRDAEVNGHDLIWPAGITAPQIVDATTELLAVGIIIR